MSKDLYTMMRHATGRITTATTTPTTATAMSTPTPRYVVNSNRPRSSTCLHHLDLGDVGTSRDMLIVNTTNDDNTNAANANANRLVSSLQKHDFAFVLRTDGSWTYAILAERREESMRFVVSLKGATKTMTRSRWLDSVRLVNNLQNRRKICCGGGFDLKEEEEVDVVNIVDIVDDDIDVVVLNDDIDVGVDTNSSLLTPAFPQRIEVEVEKAIRREPNGHRR
mmetsp:Transcript_29142/g.60743  ORF Transcript_29142/g.60743 Transcript_29142/m.60743 type:complete len:223 (-) Transcript_29142:123-791(-)